MLLFHLLILSTALEHCTPHRCQPRHELLTAHACPASCRWRALLHHRQLHPCPGPLDGEPLAGHGRVRRVHGRHQQEGQHRDAAGVCAGQRGPAVHLPHAAGEGEAGLGCVQWPALEVCAVQCLLARLVHGRMAWCLPAACCGMCSTSTAALRQLSHTWLQSHLHQRCAAG
jgi:hypothetical protein